MLARMKDTRKQDSPCVLVQPDGWARGEREGYGEPCDVTSLSLSLSKTAVLIFANGLCTKFQIYPCCGGACRRGSTGGNTLSRRRGPRPPSVQPPRRRRLKE